MHIRSKRLASLVAVSAAALLAVSACAGGGSTETKPPTSSAGFADCDAKPDECNKATTKKGGELIYALEQEFTNWNVVSDEGNAFAGSQALSGVVPSISFFLPSGKLAFNKDLLAEDPKLTVEKPQTMVYKIRPEAKWDDGTPITVDDFVFNWYGNSGKKEQCTECISASTSGYELIKSIEGSDGGKTVTVTLEDGKVYPEWTGLFTLYPAHVAAKAGFDWKTPAGMQKAYAWFGTEVPKWSGGPYKIESFTKGQSLVQVPNPAWYGTTKPSLDKLIFRFITQQDQLIPALKNREIHAAGPQPSGDLVTQAKGANGVHYRIGHGYQWEHLDLNLKNKWLADAELRKAIFTAISVKDVIARTYGQFDPQAKPLGSHNFFPGDSNYKDVVTATGQGSGDVEKAKSILTAAGYTLDGGQLKKGGQNVGPLRFRHTKGNQLRATTAELVQARLKQIGIEIKIEVTETLGATLAAGDFDIMIFAWVGNPFFLGSAEQNWLTGGGGNYGKYSNPAVDAKIKEAVQTLDLKKAAGLINEALEIMAKDAYVLPLAQKPTFLMAYSDYVNIRDNPTNSGPNYNNGEWGLKAA